MPSQSAIAATILNASYKLASLTYANYNLVQSGHIAIQLDYMRYFNLNLQGLTYQYDNALYTQGTTVTLYNRLNQLIGIPYGAIVDPNFQNPNTSITVISPVVEPIEFMITAGEPIPYEYPYALSGQPDVSFYISNGSGGLTTNGATNITNNIIAGVMYIYGNDDGSGGFNEDTYVRISP